MLELRGRARAAARDGSEDPAKQSPPAGVPTGDARLHSGRGGLSGPGDRREDMGCPARLRACPCPVSVAAAPGPVPLNGALGRSSVPPGHGRSCTDRFRMTLRDATGRPAVLPGHVRPGDRLPEASGAVQVRRARDGLPDRRPDPPGIRRHRFQGGQRYRRRRSIRASTPPSTRGSVQRPAPLTSGRLTSRGDASAAGARTAACRRIEGSDRRPEPAGVVGETGPQARAVSLRDCPAEVAPTPVRRWKFAPARSGFGTEPLWPVARAAPGRPAH